MNLLEVGRIARPHGLRGQVVVELWTNRAERMTAGTSLETDGGALVIEHATPLPDDRWLVSFGGLGSREAAEARRGQVLRAEALDVEGALWVHQMVGAAVVDAEGNPVGRVEAVQANPASDLLVLEDGRLIPLTFVQADGRGQLTVDGPPGLLEP